LRVPKAMSARPHHCFRRKGLIEVDMLGLEDRKRRDQTADTEHESQDADVDPAPR